MFTPSSKVLMTNWGKILIKFTLENHGLFVEHKGGMNYRDVGIPPPMD